MWNQSLHISEILAEWFWKRWSLKSLNLTKEVVCFSQSVEWTKNERALIICCCSHVFCVYYYLYKLKCHYFFWKKHEIPANNNHERSDNSLSWSAHPRWSLEVFKILIFRRASSSLFYYIGASPGHTSFKIERSVPKLICDFHSEARELNFLLYILSKIKELFAKLLQKKLRICSTFLWGRS